MSQIKGKDTKPEMVVRRFLFSRGFRYRLHSKKLAGKPDLVFSKHEAVIFVHGCFWHGHEGCRLFVIPKTRSEWWIKKITSTKERDKKNASELLRKGIKVLTVFECELKPKIREQTLDELVKRLVRPTYDD